MVIVDVKNAGFYTIRLIDWIYHLLVSPLGMKTHQDFFCCLLGVLFTKFKTS